MKILTNTQNYLVGWISRVVQNMILDPTGVFEDIHFVTINLEKDRLKNKKIRNITRSASHTSIEWYYERRRFTERLSHYTSIPEIELDFQDLIDLFRDKIAEQRPDLIILNWTGILPWALMRAASYFNIPVIVYYHGSITEEERSTTKDNPLHILFAFEASFLQPEFHYIFPSLLLQDLICTRFWIDAATIHSEILPNSVPKYFFRLHQKQSFLKRGKIRVGFIMRWCEVKNKAFVLRFIRYAQENLPHYEIYLITDKEEQAIREIGDMQQVFLCPQLQHEPLGDFLHSKVDIILCPSRFETYGNIAQEAMACWALAFIHQNMGVAETFEAIGSGEYITNFESIPLPVLIQKIHTSLMQGIHPESIHLLKSNYVLEVINKRRLDFFQSCTASRKDAILDTTSFWRA